MTNTSQHDTDALLAELGWIQNLARRLVGQDADDLVQETWAQASGRLPSRDRPLRPWLASIARNLASNLYRSKRHRRDRETSHAGERPAHTPSPAELLERGEIHRHLVDAVLALEDPYRTVLLLRYFEGLQPADIAKTSGQSASTVRTQISRGVERLRAHMDRANGGDRSAWVGALSPLVGGRLRTAAPSTTAGQGRRLPQAVHGGATTSAFPIVLKALAVAAALLLIWTVRSLSQTTPEPEITGRQSSIAQLQAKEDLDVIGSARSREPRTGAAPVAAVRSEGHPQADQPVRLTVLDEATGAPVPHWRFRESMHVETDGPIPPDEELGPVEYQTDALGQVQLDRALSGIQPMHSFDARERMLQEFRPSSGAGLGDPLRIEWVDGEATLQIEQGPVFWVHLDRPSHVAKADVLFVLNERPVPDTWLARVAVLETAQQGDFLRFTARARGRANDLWLHAFTLDGLHGASQRLDGANADGGHVSLTLEPRAKLVLDLVGEGGQSVDSAETFLFAGSKGLDDFDSPYLERVDPLADLTRTDKGIRARHDALLPGAYTLEIVARGFELTKLSLELDAGEITRRVALVPRSMNGVLKGTVTSTSGTFHEPLEVYGYRREKHFAERPIQGDVQWALVDETWRGTFELEGVEPGEHAVVLTLKGSWGDRTGLAGYLVTPTRSVRDGETAEFVLDDDFEPLRIEITANDEVTGEPIEHFRVHIRAKDGVRSWSGTAFDGTAGLERVRWADDLQLTVMSNAHVHKSVALSELPEDRTFHVELAPGWSGGVYVRSDSGALSEVEVTFDGAVVGLTDENGMFGMDLPEPPERIRVRKDGWETESIHGVNDDGLIQDSIRHSGSLVVAKLRKFR